MRRDHVGGRGVVVTGVAGLASLTLACNAILGVEDVSPVCQVESEVAMVVSDAQASLSHFEEDGLTIPEAVLQLGASAQLTLWLYDNAGQHGVLNAPGTYVLTADDARYETCGICVFIKTNVDAATGSVSQAFWALGQGELSLTAVDRTQLVGSMRDLQFRQVTTTDGNTVEVENPCTVTVDRVEMNLASVVPATP